MHAKVKADAQPEIRIRSVCGEGLLTAEQFERAAPNESNVVVFTLRERLMPKKFHVAIDPDAKSVKLGSVHVPTPLPDITSIYGDCPLPVTPGTNCEREWAEQRTGKLAYWARIAPSYAFKPVPESQGTYQKNACIARRRRTLLIAPGVARTSQRASDIPDVSVTPALGRAPRAQ